MLWLQNPDYSHFFPNLTTAPMRDIDMTSILFPSPEELAADPALAQLAVDMHRIINVANGNFTHATPEPRRHDPASVRRHPQSLTLLEQVFIPKDIPSSG